MNEQKLDFLQNKLISLAEKIDPDQKPAWGKMSAQHMLEHVAKFFEVSTNKRHFDLVTPVEYLPKYKEFLWSDKEFRENTKAAMLPEEPEPLMYENYNDALQFLKQEVSQFFSFFKDQPALTTQHPAFGDLNFEEWVQLHHKHVIHHLRQFGVQF
ncbi:MAG: DUF1569 domain-containing protein [Bacteroidota bacterium]